MHEQIRALLSWQAPNLEQAQLAPASIAANTPELINHYRLQLPHLRPGFYDKLTRADQARLDGLLVGVLLLDGLLSLPESLQQNLPLRLAADDMAEYQFTHQHVLDQRVDFATRMMIEKTGKRSRDLLQAGALLGNPWFSGWRYRLLIARTEQWLRLVQTRPEILFYSSNALTTKDMLMIKLRVFWRVLSKQA